LNAYAERWVRSVKDECLSQLILFGEHALRHALRSDVSHYHQERPHQGKGNMILMPAPDHSQEHDRPVRYRERLGGLLTYYYREAA
jgi:putative transposase